MDEEVDKLLATMARTEAEVRRLSAEVKQAEQRLHNAKVENGKAKLEWSDWLEKDMRRRQGLQERP
jgi:outer membrane murein-binding lipoprotein Lpp